MNLNGPEEEQEIVEEKDPLLNKLELYIGCFPVVGTKRPMHYADFIERYKDLDGLRANLPRTTLVLHLPGGKESRDLEEQLSPYAKLIVKGTC